MIFMFPFSRIIITKYYIIFFLLIFSSTSTANKSNHEEKLKLKNIHIRMHDVSTKIKEAKNKQPYGNKKESKEESQSVIIKLFLLDLRHRIGSTARFR